MAPRKYGSTKTKDVKFDRWQQLAQWTPEQRASTQDLLQRAGYLPKSYNITGGLDRTFVSNFTKYMNERRSVEEGGKGAPHALLQALTAGGQFAPRGRGGGRAAAPTFGVGSLESRSIEGLKEKLINFYQSWTGATPTAPSLEFVTSRALGGKASFDIQADIQATPQFQTRFKAMPAGMDVREYDSALVKGSSLAFDVAGRKPREDELAKLFAGDGRGFYESLKEG